MHLDPRWIFGIDEIYNSRPNEIIEITCLKFIEVPLPSTRKARVPPIATWPPPASWWTVGCMEPWTGDGWTWTQDGERKGEGAMCRQCCLPVAATGARSLGAAADGARVRCLCPCHSWEPGRETDRAREGAREAESERAVQMPTGSLLCAPRPSAGWATAGELIQRNYIWPIEN